MKRILVLLFVLSSYSSFAQWSTGVRSGLGFWNVNEYDETTGLYQEVKKELWQNQLYVRYEFHKEFALEAGFGIMSTESAGERFGLCGVGLPSEFDFVSGQRYREEVYTLDLRGIVRPTFMRWGRLSNEVGLILAPGIARVEKIEKVMEVRTTGTIDHEQSTFESSPSIQVGCEDLIRYRIGKHAEAIAVGGYRVQSGARFFNSGMYAQVGLGYRF